MEAEQEIQQEYLVVAMRHDGTCKPLVIHEDFEEARSAALQKDGGFVAVPTDGTWEYLKVDHGYRSILIYKVDRVPKGVTDLKAHLR